MNLTNNEKKVLYGIVKFPNYNDKMLSEKIFLKQSTISAIRKRLKEEGYYKIISVPMLQNLGAEMLVLIHTNFNPVIPLEKRIEITEKSIEAYEEIVFSMGEEDKGFSISFSRNYTDIGKINDIRAKTFGKLGLLDREYPKEVIFPFEISRIYRFFTFAPLLSNLFGIDDKIRDENLFKIKKANLGRKEVDIFCKFVENPEASLKEIAEKAGITRHTAGRMKRKFFGDMLKLVVIPDFSKLNLKILSFCHLIFDPKHAPADDEIKKIIDAPTIFFAARNFEYVSISMHRNYESYKFHKMQALQKIRENGWEAEKYIIRTFSIDKAKIIKDINFLPITKKLLRG
jgi:DNA-binding MarR family transcriptional regulator